MKAVGQFRALPIEDPESLVDREIAMPAPRDSDLLVRVEAISVNPFDVHTRKRKPDDGVFSVLGWDVAGEVVEVGANVSSFSVGDAVFYAGDKSRPGANSEYHVVDAALVGHRPKTLDATRAAALPLTTLTAWESLYEGLGLRIDGGHVNKSLLIVGGAGGVGSMAIQLARLVPGLDVVATASRPQSQAWCKDLGAHAVIDHFSDMRAQMETLGRRAPDLILILNNPDHHYAALADLIAPQGRMCSIVPFAAAPNLNQIQPKSVSFHWESVFTRPVFDTPDKKLHGEILNEVAVMIDDGHLISTAGEALGYINAQNLRLAHAHLEQGQTIGKIVLAGFE
ncbi:zinc-binding alcohol dehydrogenase family protein [Burkholderia gladioli]|uniref:zinc-binding alcohol dehydrogenase family protein n=1 Tax=Burkholderia gladioli TaxID=28095 RepID=UPI00163E0EA6|nr:zinc-binding alcohol dehydrogenase family protein [Burkholderia gladioli]